MREHQTSDHSFAQPETLAEGFWRTVGCWPDRVAVRCGGCSVSYRELADQVSRLVAVVAAAGRDGVGRSVGVLLDRSVEMVAAAVAVVSAGLAYVPLDPVMPRARLAMIVEDADPVLVLTSRRLAELLPDGVVVVCVDEPLPELAGSGAALSESPGSAGGLPVGVRLPGAGDCAYVIFTSGTTGRPKGVQVSHRNAVRLFSVTDSLFGFGGGQVWSMFHSFAFDVSVWEMWGALLHGDCLLIIEQEVVKDPRAVWELLRAERVAVLSQTPTAFNQLIAEDAGRAELLPLRWVILAGEALRPGDLVRWVAKYGDDQPELINMYGITETTVHASYRRVRRQDLSEAGSPIGRPLPDLDFLLVDEQLRPVPPGQPGEILVTGPGVSMGYLNNPELTRQRFPTLPDGRRAYRSGDLARLTDTGEYDYLGRRDDQVKIRGYRIELGEIQAVLTTTPGVVQTVVVVNKPVGTANPVVKPRRVSAEITDVRDLIRGVGQRSSAIAEPRIIAYIVSSDELDVAELFARLRERLPHYMVPSFVVAVAGIPMTENGKVDRSRLPAPNAANILREPVTEPSAGSGDDGADAGLIRTLCVLFGTTLHTAGVQPDDSFFAVGGDSILALKLRAEALRHDITLELADIYSAQTPRALAGCAQRQATPNTAVEVEPFALLSEPDRDRLPAAGIVDAYPVGTLQAGLLFHSAFDVDVNMYCDIFMFRLRTPYHRQELQAAIARAVARHEILRTSFDFDSCSEPLQLVHRSVEPQLSAVDLRGMAIADQQAALDAWQHAERRAPYDWAKPPLVRFAVHLLTDDEFMLSMSFHDALLDGWSESSLITEILSDYWLLCQGAEPEPAAAPASRYADFIALERHTLKDSAVRQFWREELLETKPTMLPAVSSSTRDRYASTMGFLSVDVEPELSDALKELARRNNASLKQVLIAVHSRVLAVLTGRSEVLVCVESNGRLEQPGGDEVIGMHLNLVPYKIRATEPSWSDLISEVLAKERQLLPMRRFPYAELQRMIGVGELSDVSFNYTHFHSYQRLASATELEVLDAKAYIQTHFTLRTEFNLDPFTGLLTLDLEANLQRVGADQLRAIADLYRNALAGVLREDEVPSRRSLLGESRWQELLVDCCGPVEPICSGYFQEFERAVAEFADLAAAECEGRVLSYRELDVRVANTASQLSELGIRTGTIVGLVADRGLECLVATMALLRIGAVYLPLAATPVARLASTLDTGRVQFVVCDEQHRPAVSAAAGDRVQLLSFSELGGARTRYTGPYPSGTDTAYVIFTSGSTGEPKGAAIRHDGMLNHILAKLETLKLGPGDRVSQDAAGTFDISIWQLLAPLVAGATVVIYPDEVSQDPPKLLREVATDGITVLEVTPSVLSVFNAELERQAGPPPLALRWVLCSGETLTPRCANAFRRQLPDVRMLNMWGATELSDDCTQYELVGPADEGMASVPIGRPIRNAKVHVLDDLGQPVLPGTPGQLYVMGVCVGAGYLNDPARTAAAFVADPLGRSAKAIAYRTGDYGRQLAGGELEFLGRVDGQVKVRGHRIELGEVEAALAAVRELQESAVVVRSGQPQDKQLAAFFVPRSERDQPAISADELRDQLAAVLPRYAIPDYLIPLDELPRTSHGKVDVRVLGQRNISPTAAAPAAGEHEPATATENIVIDTWTRVLRLDERPGPLSNFFALGGHSLHAAKVMARLRDHFGTDLPLRLLFDNTTPRALAARLEQLSGTARGLAEVVPAQPADQRLIGDAGFALNSESTADNIHIALLLIGQLDVPALGKAFRAIVDRHPPLRTTLRLGATDIEQVIGEPGRFSMTVEDLRLPDEEDWAAAVSRVVEREARRPFDLEDDDMLRVRLLRIAPERHALILTVHHVASDGWSDAIVSRELPGFYRHFKQQPTAQQAPVPPARIEDGEYSDSLAEWLDSPAMELDLLYWRQRLEGLPPVHQLPMDHPRSIDMTYVGQVVSDELSEELTDAIRQLGRSAKTTPFVVLYTAFVALLGLRAGTDDVVVGSPVTSRSAVELESIIGTFVNSLVLRASIDRSEAFEDFLNRSRDQILRDFEHHHVPFDLLVSRLNPARSPAHSPSFQIMFIFQDNEPVTVELEGLDVVNLRSPEQASTTDLLLSATEQNGTFRLAWQYNSNLFDGDTVTDLAGDFKELMRAASTNRDMRVGELLNRQASSGEQAVLSAIPNLLRLRQSDARLAPVFALPGILGLGESFAQLSTHFADRSFYALSARDVVRSRAEAATVATLAADSAAMIADAAAGQPVHLAGHSFGGTVSLYVAAELERMGVPVASLILLDAFAPAAGARKLAESRPAQLMAFFRTLAELFPMLVDAATVEAIESVPEREFFAEAANLIGLSRLELLGGDLASAFEDYRRMCLLGWPEPPASPRPPALLVEATERSDEAPRLGWHRLMGCGSLACAAIDAGHESMLRNPHAADVAVMVQQFLSSVEARNGDCRR